MNLANIWTHFLFLIHEKYILRCLAIAKNGLGTTRPNPAVGAVVVVNNMIVGEGYTSPYGGNHAEVNAINAVKDKSVLPQATVYVTLEPCVHFGKTPPCTDLLIRHQIKNVVIGCVDTNNLVAGKGIERLKKAGCNVTVGVLEDECKAHHKRFLMVQNKKRPYIILKWAETKDGFVAPLQKTKQEPVWVTNQYSQQLVHKWRSEEHAILVGTNTVIADNPSLTVRNWEGNNPIRIVIDRDLKISSSANVLDGSVKTIVLSEQIKENRQNFEIEKIDFTNNVAFQICKVLHEHQIQSVIIEGGTKTLQTFIDEDLWDEARIFTGNLNFKKGIPKPMISGKLIAERRIKEDLLTLIAND